MATETRAPGSRTFQCGYCGALAEHTGQGSASHQRRVRYVPDGPPPHAEREEVPDVQHVLYRCRSCSGISYRVHQNPTRQVPVGGHTADTMSRLVFQYPHPGAAFHESVPAEVRALGREAVISFSAGCNNACVAMVRAALEQVARVKGPDPAADADERSRFDRKSLAAQYDHLLELSVISPPIHSLCEILRKDGNSAVHDGTATGESATASLNLLDKVLLWVFETPWLVEHGRARHGLT